MNADAIRHFYEYHFAENRKLWDSYLPSLSDEQFTQHVDYSIGSVRNQMVHLMSCDNYWFSALIRAEFPDMFNPADFKDREAIRSKWDKIEQSQREYLASLTDDILMERPFTGEDDVLYLWQVLLHVVSHGIDHRAQILRIIHDLGVETGPQDYIFYTFENLWTPS